MVLYKETMTNYYLKSICLTPIWDLNLCYHPGSEWYWNYALSGDSTLTKSAGLEILETYHCIHFIVITGILFYVVREILKNSFVDDAVNVVLKDSKLRCVESEERERERGEREREREDN